ncbi:DUF763 domain-containing protein [Treponema sp.]|uniref:DUF763 domain-containing protein n=1 Tax=Treponema sp. TaxID=166 RepID=UPI0025F9F1EF|nr:DUF763 domain-containing protein [Treponema sp.]MCR5217611.1 DUF763 domain-containing protein [Treponema sp.]
MIKRTGHADLPLHTGVVPRWLADRMMLLGTEIVEALLINYGKKEFLRRLSDPLWFQSLGSVLGMDWHSSGITTSVMYALKRGINARSREFGLYVCGGRGKFSRQTPDELLALGERTGLDGNALVKSSKLCAKVDNTAVQDGYQLYQHNFIISSEGDWSVVQQGMNVEAKTARRYHWCSANLRSFVEEPHTGVIGENRGNILNLTAADARETRSSILDLSNENPDTTIRELKDIIRLSNPLKKDMPGQLTLFEEEEPETEEIVLTNGSRNCIMPAHHEVRPEDVDLKRLGGVLATAYEKNNTDFESLLLTPGLGPRTLQSLTLVSEVINGTPSRFTDPARFSFAHGGKDGHPFPVPTRVYDESIAVLGEAIEKAKLGYKDKSDCLRRLHSTALQIERNCSPEADFDATINHENEHSKEWGGRTCKDR